MVAKPKKKEHEPVKQILGVPVHLRLTRMQMRDFKFLCEQHDANLSEMVRYACNDFLENVDGTETNAGKSD